MDWSSDPIRRLVGMHPCGCRFKAMVAGKFMAVKKAPQG